MRQSKLYYCQMLRTVSKDKYSVPDRYYTSDNWPSNDIIKHENCIIKIKLINLIHVDFCGSINLQNLFYRWLTYRQLKTGKSKGIYQYPLDTRICLKCIYWKKSFFEISIFPNFHNWHNLHIENNSKEISLFYVLVKWTSILQLIWLHFAHYNHTLSCMWQ